MNFNKRKAAILLTAIAAGVGVIATAQKAAPPVPLSPTALAVSHDAKSLFVACATGKQVLEVNLQTRKIARALAVPGTPSGLALSGDGARLYVTCAAPVSTVAVVDVATGRVAQTLSAGHTANSPLLSTDGKLLYVTNRFNNDVSVIELQSRKQIRRIPAEREPVSIAATRDGKLLLVANHLPVGRADADVVTASVSVVDPHAGTLVKTLRLPNGSGQLEEIKVSPDGRFAVVAHVLARHQTPTSQIDRGWMNTNAISIIDIQTLTPVNTVLLDGPMHGAASPWALAWSADGSQLVVTHAGAHELSVIDFPALLKKLDNVADKTVVPDSLDFVSEVRRTIPLRGTDRGPRAVAIAGSNIYAANYFSDSLSVIGIESLDRRPDSIALGPKNAGGIVRKGEAYFHDADLCFQRWQSCSGCHPGDGRADALNWDLLNDGIGNPKNSRSLLLAHRTPPTMSLGIRDTAEIAVRSGIRYILFTQQPPEVALALDAYLKSLKPVPSPHLVDGKLSAAALRGRAIFNDPEVGCSSCHPSGLFTNLKSYDVGTTTTGELMDTPTLVEVWRTAPYLHDGSAAGMREVLIDRNTKDRHGKTSHLTKKQIDDLVEYVLSL